MGRALRTPHTQMGGDNDNDEDLQASNTAGYKVGEKKTAEELAKLDANDESLNKWKESLGLKGQVGDSSDSRNVVILSLAMQVTGRDDVVLDLASALPTDNTNLVIKEGIEYRLKVTFKVNRDVISGLKYLHVVKRKGIKVDKMEEMFFNFNLGLVVTVLLPMFMKKSSCLKKHRVECLLVVITMSSRDLLTMMALVIWNSIGLLISKRIGSSSF